MQVYFVLEARVVPPDHFPLLHLLLRPPAKRACSVS